jgi:hypothetical protein
MTDRGGLFHTFPQRLGLQRHILCAREMSRAFSALYSREGRPSGRPEQLLGGEE